MHREVKHDHGGGRARGDRQMSDRVMGISLGDQPWSWTYGRLLAAFLGKMKGPPSFSGFGVHVDNFIRWRLRSDIA